VASRLREVARFAGLSELTVSRVLSGGGNPTPATLATVLTALDVLGYPRPDALRGNPERIVGLVLPDLRNPTFPAFADELTVALLGHQLVSALCTRTSDGVNESQYIDMLLGHDTAGIIFVGSSFADAGAKQGRALRGRRIPTVLINAADDNPERTRVSVDDTLAARQALDHLVGLGHSTVGLIIGPRGHVPSARKLAAFREYCRGVPRLRGSLGLFASTIFSIEGGQNAAAALLGRGVTGIVCASDFLALGAIRAVRRRGLAVPDDVSVIGFDDSRYMVATDPPLTTLRQPVPHMARAAVDALMDQIGGAPPEPDERFFEPELIVRESTGPART
jgi:LacI family transcriptional regulator, repressor for deo operon, udp, cdd, tsx, nupC, and nupG